MPVEVVMTSQHRYRVTTNWTGNLGTGTSDYRMYSRDHEIGGPTKSARILGSSDPHFRGDEARYNPEETLVASLSACHMLWLLHLCADAGITVTDYLDEAEGSMAEDADGSGQFTQVILRPQMTILEGDRQNEAHALHDKAHAMCFIARSVNFPVLHEARVQVASQMNA
jgi:organic hydroperoxide reductase OsmC/OhrA